MKQVELTDEQYDNVLSVLGAVSEAEHGLDAVWYAEDDREDIEDARDAIEAQE